MAGDPDSTNHWLIFTPEPTPDAGVGAEESKPVVAEPMPAQGAADVRPEESPPPDRPDELAPSTSDALERDTEKTPAVNASTSEAETASTSNTETTPIAGGGPVNVGWVDLTIAHAIGRAFPPEPAPGPPGSLARGLEESPSPDVQPFEPAPAPAVWSQVQMLAWIISRVETKALTPGMLPKIEWAGKELAKELKKMLARSVEIDRAVLEGQTPHRLSEGIFRISGLRSGALAHLLRIGHLTPEDVQWDDIDGDPEGVKRLWPAAVTPVTPATPADRQLYAEGGFEPAARAEESMPEPAPTEPSRVEPVSPSAPADAKGGAVAAIPETVGAQPKERRRPARDPVLLVLRELWPPNGVPPDHVSNPEIIQAVGNALEARRQRVPDRKTILRAAGRDPS